MGTQLGKTYQVRVLDIIEDPDIVELDVEILVDALEGAANLDIILELDGHLVVDEGLEEAGTSPTVSWSFFSLDPAPSAHTSTSLRSSAKHDSAPRGSCCS